MKSLASLFFLLLVSCTAIVPRPEVPPHVTTIQPAVVALTTQGRIFCSGVWIGEVVVTAAHCLVFIDDMYILGYDGDSERAVLVLSEVDLDVAVIRPLVDMRHSSLRLSNRSPTLGEAVVAYGHPWGRLFYWSRGEVISGAMTGISNRPQLRWFLHNSATFPGMSGGPVVDAYYQVLGITSFGLEGERQLSGAVHTDSIRRIIGDTNDLATR